MPGWGGYQKPKKSPEQIDLQRRRELGQKYFSDITELQAIAAKSRVKVQHIPAVPDRHWDSAQDEPPPQFAGPCQTHVQHFRKYRAAKSAGKLPPVVVDDAPYVSEREAALEASREYHRERARRKATEPPGRLKRRSPRKKK